MSMERFADELERALLSRPGIQLQSTAIHPSWLARAPVVGAIDTYASRFIRYPLHARRHTADIYHIVDHGYGHVSALLPPARTVITCHDLMLLRAAEGNTGFDPRSRSVARFRWSTSYLRHAAHVVCVSEATRADVLRFLNVPRERTSVVPLGVDERFAPLSNHERRTVRRRITHDETERLIGHVSTGNPYKNDAMPVRVLHALRDRGIAARLVRAGRHLAPDIMMLARELGVQRFVTELGRVSDQELVNVYGALDVFLFPSHYEGFGFPPLEAMACGTPIVTSSAPALAEVVRDAGIMIEPTDLDGFTDAVAAILASPMRADSLRRRGLRRAGQFTWARTSEGYANVYERVWRDASKADIETKAAAS